MTLSMRTKLFCFILPVLLTLGCAPTSAVSGESSSVLPAVSQTVSAQPEVADANESTWEIKRMTVDVEGVHLADGQGVLRQKRDTYFAVEDYVFADGSVFSQAQLREQDAGTGGKPCIDSVSAEGFTSLLTHGMLGFASGGARGCVIEYHGFFYFRTDGDRVYPLSCEPARDNSEHERFLGLAWNDFRATAENNWRAYQGSTPTGLESPGWNIPDPPAGTCE